MFERSLSSLINGLRSHKASLDQQAFLSTVLDEIRQEVKSGDMHIKSQAVLKMTYLQMLGHPIPAASFHILETMASPRYHLKHIGYLAAAQCFTQQTEVLILATNMIKKDLNSTSALDISVSLNGLSHILTPELASNLSSDVISLLSHSKAPIRKKSILVLYGIIVRFPEALEKSFDKLRNLLDDNDKGVVGATVNIVCELARRDAVPFVPLAPQLFHLLTTSTNNWMLIKLVKLFGALTPIEPRLVGKLLPPLTTIIQTTPAMSLLYECIHTLIIGGMLGNSNDHEEGEEQEDYDSMTFSRNSKSNQKDLAQICLNKLKNFLNDSDQNLKYISLRALEKLSHFHSDLVREELGQVLKSLKDNDLSIRLRCVELISRMACRENLVLIVESFLKCVLGEQGEEDEEDEIRQSQAKDSLRNLLGNHGSNSIMSKKNVKTSIEPSYKLLLIEKILYLTSFNTYAFIIDFEWLIKLLISLVRIPEVFNIIQNQEGECSTGKKLREEIVDITARVRAIRPLAIRELSGLLKDHDWIRSANQDQMEILGAAAWVCGEYSSEVANPKETISLLISPTLTTLEDSKSSSISTKFSASTTSTASIPYPPVLCSLIHNSAKLFSFWASRMGEEEEIWLPIAASIDGNDQDTGRDGSSLLERRRNLTSQVVDVAKLLDQGYERLERSEDAEVQERAVEFRQLLTLLLKDLENYLNLTDPTSSSSSSSKESSTQSESEDSKSLSNPSEISSKTLTTTPSTQTQTPPTAAESLTKSLSHPRPRSLHLLSPLFLSHPLGPVGEKAQSKVPRPKGLDLDSWIIEPTSWELDDGDSMTFDADDLGSDDDGDEYDEEEDELARFKRKIEKGKGRAKEDDREESRARSKRKELQSSDPFYLKSNPNSKDEISNSKSKSTRKNLLEEEEEPPLVKLSLDDLPSLSNLKKNSNTATTPLPKAPVKKPEKMEFVLENEEMPAKDEVVKVKKVAPKKKVKKEATGVDQSEAQGAKEGQEGKEKEKEKEKEKKKKQKKAVVKVADG